MIPLVWFAALISFVSIMLISSLLVVEGTSRPGSRIADISRRLLLLALCLSLSAYMAAVAGLFLLVIRAALV